MDKLDEKSLEKDHLLKCGPNSKIYVLSNGKLYKRLSNLSLRNCDDTGIGLESRLLISKELEGIEGVVLPIDIVYDYDRCVGYTMEYINGITLYDFLEKKSNDNMEVYSNTFGDLERIIVEINHRGGCNPDLLTKGNVLVSREGVQLIDYDGINIEYPSTSMSDCLVDLNRYIDHYKFCRSYYMFTKELDKVSLLLLYFRLVFKVSYNKVNSMLSNSSVSLCKLYDELGMYDRDLQYMMNCTFSTTKTGFYIGSMDRIIRDKFELVDSNSGKKLIKK